MAAGVYAGGALGSRAPPPPSHLEKSSAQKCPKEERKFRPDKSAKKNVHVPLRYDKIKTKKLFVGNRITIIVVWEINKQVNLAFLFVFIVYRTVSNVFERLLRPSGTGPNVLKS